MRIDIQGDGPILVWLRKDLRLADNPALAAALATGRAVIPVYILDETPGIRPMGGASLWWLDKSLQALSADIAARGGQLVLRRGRAAAVLDDLIVQTGAAGVVWNRLYDKASIDRDAAIKAGLKARGLACESYNAGLLNEPWTVKNGSGEGYKVFTPYWRAAREHIADVHVAPAPAALPAPISQPPSDRLADWGLHPSSPDWSGGFSLWTPGEAGAAERLQQFLAGKVLNYADQRDIPGVEVTSRLAPHLHFGEIGPRQVWAATRAAITAGAVPAAQGDKFLSEIGWREFNHSILFHRPDITTANFRPEFDAFPWNRDDADFTAWTRGQTGYPIVDAGMRELWTTGFMHNRVRMIVASFLVKHLLIDWRDGEAWFWDTLVDADLPNNVGNWQWTAGSGADAAPYFRIFNPITQGEKFDPRGVYVRRWVPELSALPDAVIHKPWTAPTHLNITARRIYARPIVDHGQARERALAAYQSLKSG